MDAEWEKAHAVLKRELELLFDKGGGLNDIQGDTEDRHQQKLQKVCHECSAIIGPRS